MRKMFKQGLVDRLHDPAALTEDGARWRWKSGGVARKLTADSGQVGAPVRNSQRD
jgi:hypothetical protein